MVSWYQQDPRCERTMVCSASRYEQCQGQLVSWHITLSAAPAFATAKLTPSIALAPNLVLFGVPSSLLRKASTAG